MRRVWSLAVACALGTWAVPGLALAEVVDVIQSVGASGSIGAVASMTVTPRFISSNANTTGISFGAVTIGATDWNLPPQYLRIAHQSNNTNWAIRILTNNKAARPTLAGKVLDAKVVADPNDDILGYGGMYGSTPLDPNNRVPIAWQAYKDPVVGGPAAPMDAQVGGTFNSPWAFIADASDCPDTSTNCRSVTPDKIDKTIEFLRVAQGDASNAFLKLHPDDGNRNSDGDVALYVTGRFKGVPADSYTTSIILELYHF